MSSYLYQATYPEAVEAAEQFFDKKIKLVEASHAFCQRFQLGKAGFTRDIFTWSFEFRAVEMARRDWDKHYRDTWHCPQRGFSTPRRPKKGHKPSDVYAEFTRLKVAKVHGDDLRHAVFGGKGALGAPGLLLHDGTLYVESPIQLTLRTGLTEITQSQYDAAIQARKEAESC